MKASAVGKMRERVTIEAQSQTVDGAGAIATTWTPIATTWARMEPARAAQVILAGRDDAIHDYEMTIRYRTDISTNSRVTWRSRKFDVHAVSDMTEQRQFLTVILHQINA